MHTHNALRPHSRAGHALVISLLAALLTLGIAGCKGEGKSGAREKRALATQALVLYSLGRVQAGGRKLAPGNFITADSRVTVGKGSLAELQLSELRAGAVVRLRAGSEFRLSAYSSAAGNTQTLELEQGRVLVKIPRRLSGVRFVVRTPTATAAVRGTAFEVVVANGRTTIRVVEGVVRVRAVQAVSSKANPAPVDLSPGQGLADASGDARPQDTSARELRRLKGELAGLHHLAPEELQPVLSKTAALMKLIRQRNGRSVRALEGEISRLYGKQFETLLLKNGRRVRGVVFQQAGRYVVISTRGVLRFTADQVEGMAF